MKHLKKRLEISFIFLIVFSNASLVAYAWFFSFKTNRTVKQMQRHQACVSGKHDFMVLQTAVVNQLLRSRSRPFSNGFARA